MPKAKKRTNTWPVIMYPEGVVVGKIRSGRQTEGGKVRHVATDTKGNRVGTYDTFPEAEKALQGVARNES